jgi:hypothetical protein
LHSWTPKNHWNSIFDLHCMCTTYYKLHNIPHWNYYGGLEWLNWTTQLTLNPTAKAMRTLRSNLELKRAFTTLMFTLIIWRMNTSNHSTINALHIQWPWCCPLSTPCFFVVVITNLISPYTLIKTTSFFFQ